METIGGSELTVPTQAMVMMLGFASASVPQQLTMTAGTGESMVKGVIRQKLGMEEKGDIVEFLV